MFLIVDLPDQLFGADSIAIENLLIKSGKFPLPSQRQLWQDTQGIEVVVVDVAETEIERPKKNRKYITAANSFSNA